MTTLSAFARAISKYQKSHRIGRYLGALVVDLTRSLAGYPGLGLGMASFLMRGWFCLDVSRSLLLLAANVNIDPGNDAIRDLGAVIGCDGARMQSRPQTHWELCGKSIRA
jgi:hypothetical protein